MKRKRNINSRITSAVVVVIILILSLIGSSFLADNEQLYKDAGLRDTSQSDRDKMYVSFIDVGQGSCTLITLGENAILVDCGEIGVADKVIGYLKNLSIDELDCVIATHPHSDHIGGMQRLLYEFEIGDFIMPEIPEDIIPTTRTYERFLTAVSDTAGRVIPAQAGETYSYGEMTVEILAPLREYDDLNDMSAVTRISYGETSVLISGDATETVEADLLKTGTDYSADLLNVAHHGSKSSSSEKWLRAVSPEYAVISCGQNNDYGHPHSVVTDRLDVLGVKYYRTDTLGTIVFSSDSEEFTKCD